jgi:hypothetical protein
MDGMYYPGMKTPQKFMKNLRHYSRSSSRDFNPVSPEYELEVPTVQQQRYSEIKKKM